MKRITRRAYRLKKFLSDDIWLLDLEELSKAKARFVKYTKILLLTIKTFSAEKIGFQAVALSFFSTMSVVPLPVVSDLTESLRISFTAILTIASR